MAKEKACYEIECRLLSALVAVHSALCVEATPLVCPCTATLARLAGGPARDSKTGNWPWAQNYFISKSFCRVPKFSNRTKFKNQLVSCSFLFKLHFTLCSVLDSPLYSSLANPGTTRNIVDNF